LRLRTGSKSAALRRHQPDDHVAVVLALSPNAPFGVDYLVWVSVGRRPPVDCVSEVVEIASKVFVRNLLLVNVLGAQQKATGRIVAGSGRQTVRLTIMGVGRGHFLSGYATAKGDRRKRGE
jgi:hypothetical protein